MNLISELPQAEQDAWHQVMLDHAYDVNEWERARNDLIERLQSQNKKANESAIRAYIACCAEAVSSSGPLPLLTTVVDDFYSRYGMEESLPN